MTNWYIFVRDLRSLLKLGCHTQCCRRKPITHNWTEWSAYRGTWV